MEDYCIFVKPIGNQRARLVIRNFAAFYLRLARVGFARRTSFKMKLIQLTQGYFAQVDDEDFEELQKYRWWINKVGSRIYAYGAAGCKKIAMHRYLLKETNRNVDIDHIDGNQLNNRRNNLRKATRAQNNANQKIAERNNTGYKGVSYCSERGLWVASVASYHIGRFSCIKEAARHYNKAAFDKWGEFARLNNVDPVFPVTEKPIIASTLML